MANSLRCLQTTSNSTVSSTPDALSYSPCQHLSEPRQPSAFNSPIPGYSPALLRRGLARGSGRCPGPALSRSSWLTTDERSIKGIKGPSPDSKFIKVNRLGLKSRVRAHFPAHTSIDEPSTGKTWQTTERVPSPHLSRRPSGWLNGLFVPGAPPQPK